jgi:hypothetical protein
MTPFYDDPSGLTHYDSPGTFYDDVPPSPSERKKMIKVVLNLSKKTILETIALARKVKTKLTGNAKFPSPDPALTVLDTATTDCETANNNYESGKDTLKQLLDIRNQKWDALNSLLTAEASYVGNHASTTADVESAGFAASAPAGPVAIPQQVHNVSVTTGDNDGSLDVHWDADATAKTFELETSPDPMTPAGFTHRDTVTKSSATLTGFTSGSRVWVRVRAINSKGKGPWSDAVSKIVP